MPIIEIEVAGKPTPVEVDDPSPEAIDEIAAQMEAAAVNPDTSSSTTETPVSEPQGAPLPGMGTPEDPNLLGAAAYRGFLRPAADLAVAGGMDPRMAKYQMSREAGGADYQPPEGAFQKVLAPLGVATPYVPILWGLGAGAQVAFNERVADVLEGAAGIGMMAKSITRFLRARSVPTVEGVRRPEYRGKTTNQAAYLDQQRVAAGAEDVARTAAKADAAAPVRTVAAEKVLATETDLAVTEHAAAQAFSKAASQAEEAAVAHHTAVSNQFAKSRAGLQEAIDARTAPEREVRAALGLPDETPDPAAGGAMLQAIGENAKTLLPGAEVGVSAAKTRVTAETRRLYAASHAAAEEAGVTLPAMSAGASEIRSAVMQWVDRIGKFGGPQEKAAAAEVMDAIHDGDVPYSVLDDLHAHISSLALTPSEFPIATKAAKKEFYTLKNTIATVLRGLETASPQLSEAASAARRHVRDVEKPFLQTARKVLGKGTTPTAAFNDTVGSFDDPTHISRLFQHAGHAEQDAYRFAFFQRELDATTDATGITKVDELATRWSRMNPASRRLLASGATKEAQTAMLRMVGGKAANAADERALKEAEHQVSAALTAMKQSQKAAEKAAKAAGIPFSEYDRVLEAQKGVKAAEAEVGALAKDSERFSAVAEREGKKLTKLGQRGIRGGTSTGRQATALYHGAQTLRSALNLSFGNMLIHGGTAFLIMRRPGLVAKALKTPADSTAGRALQQAMKAATAGWRGFSPVAAEMPAAASAIEGAGQAIDEP